jgi:hypothetical protein
MKTFLLFIAATLVMLSGCATPAGRQAARQDRRDDRVDNRYDRRDDRYDRVATRYSY